MSDATLVGYVELQGTFTFPSAVSDGKASVYSHAFVLFDAQTGNLLVYGGLQTQSPTPTPTAPAQTPPTATPTATPTAAPTPVVKFTVAPTTYSQACAGTLRCRGRR